MKLIQAMKAVKANKEAITDLHNRIGKASANLSNETPLYGPEQSARLRGWLQSCQDRGQENIRLLVAIARTNLATPVTITLGDKAVTKSIAEWVWRRREYADMDMAGWQHLTDRNLRETVQQSSTGEPLKIAIVRHFDPMERDNSIAAFRSEPHEIDAALEVVNATTDLLEG